MKAMTVRVSDDDFDKLLLLSQKNKTSLNKFVYEIIIDSLDKPFEMTNCLNNFEKNLDSIIYKLNCIEKRQIAHFKVSKQHFVNRAFLSNATISDDKCLNQLLSKDNSFND